MFIACSLPGMSCNSAQAKFRLHDMDVALCCVVVLNEQALGNEFPEKPVELNHDFVVVVEGVDFREVNRYGTLH